MKKTLKWFLRIFLSLIGLIIIAMIVIPMLFKDEMLAKVKEEINKSVNAKVEFADFKLSLFKSFPDLNVGLYDVSVTGVDQFESDTLLSLKSFNVQVNLMSAFKKNVLVKGIILDKPYINAKVLADSTANWDIVKPSEVTDTLVEVVDTTLEPLPYRLDLQKFQIKDASIYYTDKTSDMYASIEDLNFILKGDFGMDYSDLTIKTSINAMLVKMGGIKYLNKAKLGFDATIGADLDKMLFTFKDNLFTLNDIALGFDGTVDMPGDDINVDVKFNTKKTSFKSLLSMVPAIYMQGFEDLKTKGNLILEGNVKGTLNETQTPSANIRLVVENAMFRYPDLPKSVENINIDLAVAYDGVNDDNTKVDLNKFHIEMAGNPFDIGMHVRTPMSDPYIKGNMNGHIVLSSFKDVIPLDDINLDGEITADVNIAGNMSTIEKEKYEDFKASGKLQLKNFIFESKDLPQAVKITETTFNFTPKYLELQSFLAQIGKSDFSLNGKIENYIAYALKDETIKGVFNFNSKFIDVNEFMTESTDETEIEDTAQVPLTVFEVPGNVDFRLQSSLDHILYDKMDITNLKGLFIIKDKKVVMENLNMNLLDGQLGVNGEYNTQDIQKPSTKMSLNIRNIEIQSAIHSFSMIRKMASILENCKGKISMQFDYTSLLDSTMSPVLNSIEGYGKLQSKQIEIVDSKTFDKLAEMIKLGDKFDNTFKDINISFQIHDGRIDIDPFVTSAGDIKIKLGGSHGVDQTMDYDLTMTVPTKYFGSAANDLLDGLLNKASAKGVNVEKPQNINIDAKITGTTTDPKISLGKGKSADEGTKTTKKEIVETAKKVVKEKAGEEIAAQAQKIIDDAQKESAKIKQDARTEADKIIAEGNKQADDLVKEAAKKGPIAKMAAEKTAGELKKKARQKADDLIKKADKTADDVVAAAQVKADNLKKEK